ncbi:ABC transporter permease [Fulvivirgaceae bacterium BMA12]|uniref:ABC transporter permease n=1 Tax=Agaribacillus aureus TaxID=3051825 RepID=A0ABT8L6K5_9BACT|nr:ABC transporter permease [Fulvivirgaceae bacterium BMA12]
MLPFTIKTALRNLLRTKQNAFIIILSLTISFSFSNVLIAFISYESNTDAFHQKQAHIYRLFSDDPFEEGKKIRFIARGASQFLLDRFPEVNKVCKVEALDRKGSFLSSENALIKNQMILAADPTFFEFFDFPISEGNRKKAISSDGIVLQEALAKKLFGTPPYIGNTVELNNEKGTKAFKVTAIIENFHENTQLKFDAVVSSQEQSYGGSLFIMLNKHADPKSLAAKINQNKDMPSLVGLGKSKYELEPLRSTYYNASNPQPYDQHRNHQIIIISWLVVILLSCTAGFNFINLYVTGLLGRRKEIGVKRVFGATKTNMTISIGIEVSIYVMSSILLSLALTYYLLPFFNTSFNTQLSFSYLTYAKVLLAIFGSILFLGLLITVYLVIFTWKLNPIRLINDKLANKVKASRFMFTIQFFISVGLMIFAYVVIQQMQYIRNKPLGFNKHLMQLQISDDKTAGLGVLKQQLLNYPQISKATITNGNPISGNWKVRYDLGDQRFYAPFLLSGDEDLVETLQLTILKGKNINPQDSLGRLVNETLVRYFDIKSPIGQIIPGSQEYIVGVVNDFNNVSLKEEVQPYIISYRRNKNCLLIDISDTELNDVLPLVMHEWEQVFPDEIFDYKLIEDELLAKHKEDTYFFRMIIGFTIASLLISCFGLYGIASFTSSRRTKEIGIRKVLGASVTSVILLLWRDYIKLIALSFALAAPIVHYFLNSWLKAFAYKITLDWWLYAIPGFLMLAIAILTISGQSIKAASADPVTSLQDE